VERPSKRSHRGAVVELKRVEVGRNSAICHVELDGRESRVALHRPGVAEIERARELPPTGVVEQEHHVAVGPTPVGALADAVRDKDAGVGTSAPMTVVTIGYEGRQLDEFVAELADRRVEIVFDVRANAASRKPGFSKRRLGEALAAAGIEYRHLPALGNPRRNRDALRAGDPAARDVFLRHLDDDGSDALDEVASAATTKTIALVCFERDHTRCHRSCITDRLVSEHPDLLIEPV
jgi:hypothetical protein